MILNYDFMSDPEAKEIMCMYVHTEKSFRNLIKSKRNQIVFTIFRLIWNQKDVRLVPNQSEIGKYDLISG